MYCQRHTFCEALERPYSEQHIEVLSVNVGAEAIGQHQCSTGRGSATLNGGGGKGTFSGTFHTASFGNYHRKEGYQISRSCGRSRSPPLPTLCTCSRSAVLSTLPSTSVRLLSFNSWGTTEGGGGHQAAGTDFSRLPHRGWEQSDMTRTEAECPPCSLSCLS